MSAVAIDNAMQGQAAIVLGAGISGLAAARLLYRAGAKVTLADDFKTAYEMAAALDIDAVETVGKGGDVSASADFLILSPGISDDHPLVRRCLEKGTPILSEIALAASFTEAPILAVTGSNGKSTVATLLSRMMAAGGYRSFLGGNIGVPFSDTLLEEQTIEPVRPIHVVEVSSFQAEHLGDFSPTAAIFLNLSPDHLNRYADMQAYGAAKLHLQDNLMEGGWIVYNHEDAFFRAALEDHPQAVPFGADPGKRGRLAVRKGQVVMGRKKLLPLEELSLPGPHNLSNMLAAATAATLMGVDAGSILQVMRTFQGLAHRLELLATINGVHYYNDSKATNIASTKVALDSFAGNVVLILGGSSKGGDFS
ncbi:MAG: UDP-N-acetylmuramoyl-L-alanine--D-glutamate ligase, partial [Candidatus Marinimicrobia bacterium]|nr:UDP-N-acetylmuramoyl-L-alanine--D-glutamate ligase [Candidatus Neomarinimicrobiota bacterium]